MHRSDPRWLITDDELDAAAGTDRQAASRAGAAGNNESAAIIRWPTLASCHRDVIAALGTRCRCGASMLSTAMTAACSPDAFEEIIDSPAARWPRHRQQATMSNCFTPPSATARCAARKRATCACTFTVRSKRACKQPTCLVLGGLNEATWPPETRSDPWLSRPMRRDLGLDPPERRIGLSAHDFAQMLGAPEIVLTRAAKLAGAPTVTSRFVQRIAALAGKARWDGVLARGNETLEAGARARCARRSEGRGAARSRSRRSRRGRRACRSPPSRTGCAIPTPSMPSISCGFIRSTMSTRRPARATAAPSFTAPLATSPWPFADGLPPDPQRQLLRARRKALRAARRLSRSEGVLVAALPAHRAMVRAMGPRPARRHCDAAW